MPIPISKIVLLPLGYSAIFILPLILSMLATIYAPARGAAGMPILRARAPQIPSAIN